MSRLLLYLNIPNFTSAPCSIVKSTQNPNSFVIICTFILCRIMSTCSWTKKIFFKSSICVFASYKICIIIQGCCELIWTNLGSSTLQNCSCMATYLPSCKPLNRCICNKHLIIYIVCTSNKIFHKVVNLKKKILLIITISFLTRNVT